MASCQRAGAAPTDGAPAPAVSTAKVGTAKVVEVDAPLGLRLTGTLHGQREAEIAANAAGRVLATEAERGDEVAAGQVVARLDTRAAALSLAEANIAVASSRTRDSIDRTECERYEKLLASGSVSPAEHDRVTAKCKTTPLEVAAAEARQAILAKNVGDGLVRAPFTGVVSERHVDVGEYVQPSSRVITIAQVEELRLELAVPEAQVAHVKRGTEVTFKVAAYPGRVFRGAVRHLAGSVRPTTRDLVVEAAVPNPDRALRPGMFADASLEVGTRRLAAVPRSAVIVTRETPHVFVVEAGRAVERVVALDVPLVEGAPPDTLVAVRDGLQPGEVVAAAGAAALTNGMKVD
ncbi:MAG: efflux RND transporter periplasmic adaptor subunit [Deltaproteobacteria bacterium]|nr:efflux RND transporter periplasmic adaptor subunit [Deltaproteobacteria bacterium]